jgi:hypothetical protein
MLNDDVMKDAGCPSMNQPCKCKQVFQNKIQHKKKCMYYETPKVNNYKSYAKRGKFIISL